MRTQVFLFFCLSLVHSLPASAPREAGGCVPQHEWCYSNGECCNGLVCDVAPGETEVGVCEPKPSDCVVQHDWCQSDRECCNGLGCSFPPESEYKSLNSTKTTLQTGVCVSIREPLCLLRGERCTFLDCCGDLECKGYLNGQARY